MEHSHRFAGFLGYQAIFWIILLLPWQFEIPSSWDQALHPDPLEAPPGSFWIPIITHLSLFLPIGVFMRRDLRWAGVALVLAGLSEFLQLFVRRHLDIYDFGIDLLGAGIGYFAAPYLIALWNTATRRSTAAVAWAVLTGYLVYLLGPANPTWTNWHQSFPLHIANEGTLNRPWLGTLYSIKLWDNEEATGQPLIDYNFADGVPPKLKLTQGFPPYQTSGGIESDTLLSQDFSFYDKILASQAFSCEVRFRPRRIYRVPNARIVSLSANSQERNFSLLQNANSLLVRVRNTETDHNGFWPELRAERVLQAETDYTARVVGTPEKTVLFLNGIKMEEVRYTRLNGLIGDLLSQVPCPALLTALWALWGVLYTWLYYFLVRPHIPLALALTGVTLAFLMQM